MPTSARNAATHDVYLEINEPQGYTAYVLALPGCFVRAATAEAALAAVPAAVQAYDDWLETHGETVQRPPVTVALHVAEQQDGRRLFTPEREALSPADLAHRLQLAAYNRADLLALVRPLPDSIRHWRANPEATTIAEVVRHTGRTERWYVSRLLPPDTLPRHEEDDTPLLQWLAHTRATAVAYLEQLSGAERAQVLRPQHETRDPEEVWSARKVLRRLLTHEREQIAHVEQILAAYRGQLLARLAAERANLLSQFWGLDAETLSTTPVFAQWTAKDILAHVGGWDAFHAERLSMVLDGRTQQIRPLGDATELDARNAELQEHYGDLSLETALALALKARGGYLALLKRASDVELQRERRLPWGQRTSLRAWTRRRYEHDARHAADLQQWRETLPAATRQARLGPKFLLRALLRATRKEFTTLAALVDATERETRPLLGEWTLKDLLGHLADWQQLGAEGLVQLGNGRTPQFADEIEKFDRFNRDRAAARREQSWREVHAAFERTHADLLAAFDALPEDALAEEFITPWGTPTTAYRFTSTFAAHAQEHAQDLRAALQIPHLPKRLLPD